MPIFPLQGDGREPDRPCMCTKVSYTTEEKAQTLNREDCVGYLVPSTLLWEGKKPLLPNVLQFFGTWTDSPRFYLGFTPLEQQAHLEINLQLSPKSSHYLLSHLLLPLIQLPVFFAQKSLNVQKHENMPFLTSGRSDLNHRSIIYQLNAFARWFNIFEALFPQL